MYDGSNGNSNVNEHYQPPTYNAPQYPYPPAPPQPYQWQPPQYVSPQPPRSGFALASFVVGLVNLALFFLWLFLVPAILTIVFGILGVRDAKHMRGRWMGWTGIGLGVFELAIGLAVLGWAIFGYGY